MTSLTVLSTLLRTFTRCAVAFSAGVDSTVLTYAACKTLGTENVLAVTAISPSMSTQERHGVTHVAQELGVSHLFVETEELLLPEYIQNTRQRCYHCKLHIMSRLQAAAASRGFSPLLEGSHADDTHSFRPGYQALRELGIRSPLAESNVNRKMIRALAHLWDLSVKDKKSTPCLASRVMYGVTLSADLFHRIDLGEQMIGEILSDPSINLRLRVHGDSLVRLEVPPEYFHQILRHKEKILSSLHELGFHFITLDLLGFRSGCYDEKQPETK